MQSCDVNRALPFGRTLGFATFLMLSFTACKPEFPLGTFSGTWTTPDASTHASASITHFKYRKRHYDIDLTIYPVLAVSKPESAHIQYSSSFGVRKLSIKSDLIEKVVGSKEVTLAVTSKHREKNTFDFCADETFPAGDQPELGPKVLHTCFGNQEVEITVKQNNQSLLEIHLTRDGDFRKPLRSELTLDEAVGRARFYDFRVMEEAEQLRQQKGKIQVARANVLPSASLSEAVTLFQFSLTPFSALTLSYSVPFLFPSNWFLLSGAKENYAAEKGVLRNLQANEMLAVQSYYYGIHRDQKGLEKLEELHASLKEFHENMESQRVLGVATQEEVNTITDKMLKLEEQIILLRTSNQSNMAKFSEIMAFHPIDDDAFTLASLDLIDPRHYTPIDNQTRRNIAQEAIDKSFELETLRHFAKAAIDNVRADQWSFLNASDIIGLHWDYLARIGIDKSIHAEIELKIKDIERTLEQKTVEMSNEFNQALELQSNLMSRVNNLKELRDNFDNGKGHSTEWVAEKVKILEDLNQAEIRMIDNIHSLMIARASWNRLTLKEFYEDLGREVNLLEPEMNREPSSKKTKNQI